MAYRRKRGMGIVGGPLTGCDIPVANWFMPSCWSAAWEGIFGKSPAALAPPPAPTGDVLTVPPSSGEEAQATVDALLNQQMAAQQELAASQVSSGILDKASSAAVAAGDAISAPFGLSWLAIAGIGLGAFALVALGGGSPRRYGR